MMSKRNPLCTVLSCTLSIVVLTACGADEVGPEQPLDPCQDVDCSGHGTCAVRAGQPVCSCDPGYWATGLSLDASGIQVIFP